MLNSIIKNITYKTKLTHEQYVLAKETLIRDKSLFGVIYCNFIEIFCQDFVFVNWEYLTKDKYAFYKQLFKPVVVTFKFHKSLLNFISLATMHEVISDKTHKSYCTWFHDSPFLDIVVYDANTNIVLMQDECYNPAIPGVYIKHNHFNKYREQVYEYDIISNMFGDSKHSLYVTNDINQIIRKFHKESDNLKITTDLSCRTLIRVNSQKIYTFNYLKRVYYSNNNES